METIYHLYSADILFLFDVNVGDVQPNIGEFGGRFPNLRENVTHILYVAFLSQHTT